MVIFFKQNNVTTLDITPMNKVQLHFNRLEREDLRIECSNVNSIVVNSASVLILEEWCTQIFVIHVIIN